MSLATALEDAGCATIEEVIDAHSVAHIVEEIATLSTRAHGLRHLQGKSETVRALCHDERVLELARSVIGPDAFVVRSLFFDKNETANWKVAWHQDLTIAVKDKVDTAGFGPWSVKDGVVHVQSPIALLERMVTVRVHLDDCAINNGPLRVLPGSHRSGRLSAQEIEAWKGRVTEKVCLVQRGGIVMMKPLILHASSPAAEPRHRRVIHLEFAAEALPNGLKWATQ